MPSRDSQTVILSRQTILLVTAVGVGLLTLCYVLGVQVGKQSAALRRPAARGSGEDLQELPAAIADQIKALEGAGDGEQASQQPVPASAPTGAPAAAVPAKPPPPVEVRMNPPAKPEPPAPAPEKDKKGETAGRWVLQLVATPDQAEAQRVAAKAKAAGFPAAVVADKGLYKTRLSPNGPKEAVDATALQLKSRGFKPYAIKIE
jgi:cell division septation protein DedD